MNSSVNKKYLLAGNDPHIAAYSESLDMILQDATKKFTLDVAPDIVTDMETDLFLMLIAVAQHKKEWIERLLWGIDFKFSEIKDSELYLPVEAWTVSKPHQLWFYKLTEKFPSAVYFIRVWEARLLCLIGDMVHKDEIKITPDEKSKSRAVFTLTHAQQQKVNHRIGFASQFFMEYCYETGIKAKPYIEALLAEFNIHFDYEFIKKQWYKEHKKGMQYRIGIGGPPK